jgi:hypothetical protein
MAETLGQMDDLHARLDALRMQQHQRVVEVAWRLGGMNPSVPDQFEGFYAALDDMRDDRAEYAEANGLAHLHERLDAMQQARQQERGHEHGMAY